MTDPVHVRTQIRRNGVTVLTGINPVMNNVFSSRVRNLQDDELPAIDIDTKDGGDIRPGSTFGPGRLLDRGLRMTVAVTVKKTDGYLDQIDEIFLVVEKRFAENNSLVVANVAACKSIQPLTEPTIEDDDSADETIARAEMQFEVAYITAYNAPQTPL